MTNTVPLETELGAMAYDPEGAQPEYRRGWNAALRAAIAVIKRRQNARRSTRFEGEFGDAS